MKISDRSDISHQNYEASVDISEFQSININSTNETLESLTSAEVSPEKMENSFNVI